MKPLDMSEPNRETGTNTHTGLFPLGGLYHSRLGGLGLVCYHTAARYLTISKLYFDVAHNVLSCGVPDLKLC